MAIARAIVNRPAILLADEPTGNLDSKNSEAVLSVLRDLNERLGQTILMITHDSHVASYGHRTVHMLDGRVHRRLSLDLLRFRNRGFSDGRIFLLCCARPARNRDAVRPPSWL